MNYGLKLKEDQIIVAIEVRRLRAMGKVEKISYIQRAILDLQATVEKSTLASDNPYRMEAELMLKKGEQAILKLYKNQNTAKKNIDRIIHRINSI